MFALSERKTIMGSYLSGELVVPMLFNAVGDGLGSKL
jgi:hypothetical protein